MMTSNRERVAWNLSVVRHVYAPLCFSQTDQSSKANIHTFVFPSFCLASSLSKLAC